MSNYDKRNNNNKETFLVKIYLYSLGQETRRKHWKLCILVAIWVRVMY